MNGWDFMNQFTQLPSLQHYSPYVYVASSSVDIADINRARSYPLVKEYISKPLSLLKLKELFFAS